MDCSLIGDPPYIDPEIDDGDLIQLTLCERYPTTSSFVTDEDTVAARTGVEYLGVKFIDESIPGRKDVEFVLGANPNISYDDDGEFIVKGTPQWP